MQLRITQICPGLSCDPLDEREFRADFLQDVRALLRRTGIGSVTLTADGEDDHFVAGIQLRFETVPAEPPEEDCRVLAAHFQKLAAWLSFP